MLTVLLTLHSPWDSLVALLMGSPSTETSSDKGKRVTTPFLLSMKQCWFSTPVPCITISCGTGASSVPNVVLPGTNEKKIQCGYNHECQSPDSQPADLIQQPCMTPSSGVDENHSRGAFCACA